MYRDGTKETETRGDVVVKYMLCVVTTHKAIAPLLHFCGSGAGNETTGISISMV